MPGVMMFSGSRSPSATSCETSTMVVFAAVASDRAKVARRLAIDQVAPAVALVGFNQREIGFDRVLQHVVATVDFPCLLAFRQRRAVAGGGKHRPQPGAGRLDPRREVALRHQLQLHFAATVEIIENLRIHLARKGADHFAHPARLEQRGETHFPVAGVVIYDGQVASAPGQSGRQSEGRLAGGAKPPIIIVAPSWIPAMASLSVDTLLSIIRSLQ